MGCTTDKVNAALAVCGTASVAMTVYSVADVIAVGVPVMSPVTVLNTNPSGNSVGVIA